jgi:hypothetical protein
MQGIVASGAECKASQVIENIQLDEFLEKLLMDISSTDVQATPPTAKRLQNIYQFDYVD